jgi:ABC-type Na+ efflux pump permease subunit
MPTIPRWIREGCTVGLIAFVTVAAFYAAFDLLAARGALYTVNQIGVVLQRGPSEIGAAGNTWPIDLGAIVFYSTLHLVVSLGIGLLVCRLVHEAELRPTQAQVALLFIVAGFAGTVALVGALSAPIREVLPWWSVIASNTAAVLVAGLVLLRRHPSFIDEMTVNPRFPAG